MIMMIIDHSVIMMMITDHGLCGQGFIFPQRPQLDHLKVDLISDHLKFDYIVGDDFEDFCPVDDGDDEDDDDVVHPVDDGDDDDDTHPIDDGVDNDGGHKAQGEDDENPHLGHDHDHHDD